VTTVDVPVSHLRENPYEIAKSQLRKVADTFAIDPNLVNVLQECKKSLAVSVPVSMDDGRTQVFQGYRVTAPRRAESATTPTSRLTKSRRSRCG